MAHSCTSERAWSAEMLGSGKNKKKFLNFNVNEIFHLTQAHQQILIIQTFANNSHRHFETFMMEF